MFSCIISIKKKIKKNTVPNINTETEKQLVHLVQ